MKRLERLKIASLSTSMIFSLSLSAFGQEKTYFSSAWIAVAGYIDQNQNITSVCEGTGKKNNYDYYMQRKRITGDFHGQAPVLWAASALLR
jgi:hypothetical protein